MIAAIYARKSPEQRGVADEAKSVTRQVEGANAFIAAKGWTLDERHVYTDDGVSGALFADPCRVQRLMPDATVGASGAVMFYDLDRFGRNARQTASSRGLNRRPFSERDRQRDSLSPAVNGRAKVNSDVAAAK